MTNHWIDLRNANVILVMGANPAENHPVSFQWIQEAQQKGGKLVVVDPRFTRTAAKADLFTRLRSGTDIAFLGGMIKHILDHELFHAEYVRLYTNASFLVHEGFQAPGDLDGLFSGYDPEKRAYDKATWAYQTDPDGVAVKDPSLQSPQCVLQLLKKHFSRYDLETVSGITGTPVPDLEKVYELYASTGKADRVATSMYAMGWTQHTVGVQNIRAMGIIQSLLGNMGRPGGGVNALRGESNVQGSTDHGLLYHILPGYLPVPSADLGTLAAYVDRHTPKTVEPKSVNWWGNRPKYITSYLKAVYGPNATPENDFGYAWLPKIEPGADYSWLHLFDQMYDGKIKGFFAWGQNPACCTSNAAKTRTALTKLDWMVTVNLFDNETASFWKGPDLDPKDVKTEVFFLPAAVSYEKEGSVTNSGRWAQWRYQAAAPLGGAKPDAEIINELLFALRGLYRSEGGALPDPLMSLTWDYGFVRADGKLLELDPRLVAQEINGYVWTDPKTREEPVQNFTRLAADGTTSSGCWIYSGSFNASGNLMARRGTHDPTGLGLYSGWAWSWPLNRRIIYNRASVDAEGNPWDVLRAAVYWDGIKWVGDVPDGGAPPLAYEKGALPFIMKREGVASLFGPGLRDGPFPEHYEPLESPVPANAMSRQRINPTARLWHDRGKPEDAFATFDARYPLVASTYRVTEHWQTGVMTRNTPWLLELQPQMFVEMSEELARERGIRNGETVRVVSIRGGVEAVALVTPRLKAFRVAGSTVHQVGLPWHYGWTTPRAGDTANLLTPTTGDPNTLIPETKAFMVDVLKKG